MSEKIKANRQALEYYKVAQELLELATNDASDFIDDYEDRDITGQDFKRETSGWLSHLDDIIDDLKGKPDPLNLLPKATALRKQLGQVSSRPADELSYDMQHSAGSPSQSKERFWNKISNMFESVVSEEPAIIRAPRDGALDVFEQPKPGYTNRVQANTRRDKPKVSNIPDEPKLAIPKRGRPDVNQFVRPSYAPAQTQAQERVEAPKIEIKPEVQSKVEEQVQKVEERKPQVEEKKMSLAERVRLRNQQEQFDSQQTQVASSVDTDELLKAAKNAAESLRKEYKERGEKVLNELTLMETDATNLSDNLISVTLAVKEFEKAKEAKDLKALYPHLKAILEQFSQYNGENLIKFGGQAFVDKYGDRIIGGASLNLKALEIKGLFEDISGEAKNSLLKDRQMYGSEDVAKAKAYAKKLLETIRTMNSALKFFTSDILLGAESNYEGRRSSEYNILANGLSSPSNDIAKTYIESGIAPTNYNDEKVLKASLNELRKKINDDQEEDRWDKRREARVSGRVRPYRDKLEGEKSFEYMNFEAQQAFEAQRAFKARNTSQQLSALINMIEEEIESPFESNNGDEVAEHASLLFSELDENARSLEKNPITSEAALSVNKLKNKLLKIVRNTALAMEPEFKGEVIDASQNAVQKLEIAVETNKVAYAPQRQANLRKDKPKVSNIPDQPKVVIGRRLGSEDKNAFQRHSSVNNPKVTDSPDSVSESNIEQSLEENEGYVTAEYIATIAIQLANDIDNKSNSADVQAEHFNLLFNVSVGAIEKSKLSIRNNFFKISKIIQDNDGDVGPNSNIIQVINKQISSVMANVNAVVSKIQINRRAIAMFDPETRKSINDNLITIGKCQEDLQKQLDNFPDWDFTNKDKSDEWILLITSGIDKAISGLQNIADALMDVTTGYEDLSRELRLFAVDITKKDGLYNHFIHEYSGSDSKEQISEAIFKEVGNGRTYMKSIIKHYEKTYRLGNW